MNDAMECAAALWGLENPEPVSLRPTKAVYTALSRRFGPVVLKINRDRGELKAEYEALSRLSGRCCCRVLLTVPFWRKTASQLWISRQTM